MAGDREQLLKWYQHNKRDLPWRKSQDAYRIWVSEVMLQQTTVAAVIPYFERFLERFPDLKTLAQSSIEDVLAHWAGLGYYSRARNLFKAAQDINRLGAFPQTHVELSNFSGFGPYTSRAVSSLAFGEKVGVVDGNVIRVLSRKFGIDNEWWTPKGRTEFQTRADELAQKGESASINQALMDFGATICTPQSPKCLICPWTASCVARRESRINELPRLRPRKQRQIWIWRPHVQVQRGRAALIENKTAPFLKGHLIWPGVAERKTKAPKKFDFRHSVTCHDIFVILSRGSKSKEALKWVSVKNLKRYAPASLVQKALDVSGASS